MTPEASPAFSPLDTLCINTIRFLAVDAIQKANSGHPGLPLGAAPLAYVLWTRFLRHNPTNPDWFNRDRFVLSAGHGSMLLYALLHLTGYDLSLDDVRQFRQWGSRTPGHPERGHVPGVETTTGPLGQGIGNAVGMAIAEAHLAARYNRPGCELIRHHTYCLASDGDLMEGVAMEAVALAGHLRLGRLVCLYDDNRISLAASTDLTFTEDRAARFAASGWHVQSVADGNDLEAIAAAIDAARSEETKPSLILVRTRLGYGSPHRQDTFQAHGSPLGADEVRLTKENLGWPTEPLFLIPDEVRRHLLEARARGEDAEREWHAVWDLYASEYPELAAEVRQVMAGNLPEGWEKVIPVFPADPKGMATRVASGKVMAALAPVIPALMGGSADLNPSTHAVLPGCGDFQSPAFRPTDRQGAVGESWEYGGRNIHFGVREHAMGAVINGMAAHGGIIPYGATFLVFCDYLRPPLRLAAMMGLHTISIFTHDSIAVGEDGPTHQPVEHLASLRAIPNLVVIRPADANETAEAWRVALETMGRPVALVLSRQNLPTLDRSRYAPAEGARRGGYVLADAVGGEPELILIATGSEVALALEARDRLVAEGVRVRVVSLPSWELFSDQPAEYRNSVLPPDMGRRLAIEAGVSFGWERYTGSRGEMLGIDRFGASAPGEEVVARYGFTVENVCRRARSLLGRTGARPSH